MPTTLSEKISSGYYMGHDLRRPHKPENTLSARASGLYAKAKAKYKSDMEEYRGKSKQREAEFKTDLLEEYGVTDHPKADKAFSIAWDIGHSNGFSEIEHYFTELLPLLKD